MKFFALLGKELRELLTLQTLLPLLITVVLFAVIGKIAGSEIERARQPQNATIIDHDSSTYSKQISQSFQQANFVVTDNPPADSQEAIARAKESRTAVVVEIPQGFGEGLSQGQPREIGMYTVVTNFSLIGSQITEQAKQAVEAANDAISNVLLTQRLPTANPTDLKTPVKITEHVVVGARQAQAPPEVVMGFVSQQTTFIPIILFIVIIAAAQMIASSIATEKENKTLETLLSAPVSRRSIVAAKMLAAGIAAALMAAVYMFGFRYYFSGLSGGGTASQNPALEAVIRDLGLTLTWQSYLLIGATLFLGILCALAIALILGSFTEDSKSVPGVISPLMILIAIPYFLVLFLDFNLLSPAVKYLVYAIPFSYPFLAAPSIFLDNTTLILWGMLYQSVFFLGAVYLAGWIFSTDRIITMRLSFRRRPRSS